MSRIVKQLKPANCACGRRVSIEEHNWQWFVKCPRAFCWEGPSRNPKSVAVKAWNKKMEKVK